MAVAAGGMVGGCGHDGRPNIVVLMADQMRAQALEGMRDAGLATHALERLALEGVTYSRALCANPLCTPARASLLTGVYPSASRVTGVGIPLPLAVPCFSEILAAEGYRTGYIGKWHLAGGLFHVPPGPARRGFDTWAAFNRNGHDYMGSVYYGDDSTPLHPVPPTRFEPYYQTDQAIEFLEHNSRAPFFLMVSWSPPHPPKPGILPLGEWEGQVPQDLLRAVDPDGIVLRPNVTDDVTTLTRAFLQGYYACILAIDRCVARVLDTLDALGLAEDTVVVFTSDHGDLGGSQGEFGKENAFLEAVQVPLFVRYPARASAKTIDRPFNHVDLAPTLLSLAAARPLPGHGTDRSAEIIDGNPTDAPPGYVQCWPHTGEPWDLVVTEDATYVEQGEGAALYDLYNDPYQQEDRLDDPAYQDKLDEMLTAMVSWRKRTSP